MDNLPEGFELHPVEDSPFDDSRELTTCKNCGSEVTEVKKRGKGAGLCPLCLDG